MCSKPSVPRITTMNVTDTMLNVVASVAASRLV